MRLVKCRKCGASIVTDDGLIERMNDTVHELNEKARRAKNYKIYNSYLNEAANVTKMMKGILHNTAQMEDRRITCNCELSELTHYLIENNLITYEKLDEIRARARKKAEERNKENQKEIDKIYGKYTSLYTPSNQTKADPTAKRALNHMK